MEKFYTLSEAISTFKLSRMLTQYYLHLICCLCRLELYLLSYDYLSKGIENRLKTLVLKKLIRMGIYEIYEF